MGLHATMLVMGCNDNSRSAVCVHGAGGGGWEWTIWARVLAARRWCVLAPDLEPASAGIAATTLVDYLSQVRNWCAGRPPDLLVGASLGGLLALALAAEVRPRKLVLINPLPPLGLSRGRPEEEGVTRTGLSGLACAEASPQRQYPDIVPWGSKRSLKSTRRALPDADDAGCLSAFRRWRDESGAVLNAAIAGVEITRPACPVLILGSEHDEDVAPAVVRRLALNLDADFELLPCASHVGPLLGRNAAWIAQRVADWSERSFSDHNMR